MEFIRLLLFNFIISSVVIGSFIPLEMNYVSSQLAILILFKIIFAKAKFTFKKQGWFNLLFLFLFGASLLSEINVMSNGLAHSRYEMIIFATLFYIFLNITGFKTSVITSEALLQAIALCSFYIIVLSFFDINFSDREVVELNDNYKLSRASTLPDRNYSSGLISFGFGILLLELERLKNKVYVFFLILVFFGSQLILASRGGVITSILIFVFYIIYEKSKSKKPNRRYVILILPVVFSLFLFDTSRIENRFREESLDDQSGRSEIRQESFTNYLFQAPSYIVFGGGGYHGYTTLANNKSIHNNFLEILYDYGLVGFIVFVFSVFRIWSMDLFNKMNILVYCLVSFSLSPIISVVYWVFLIVAMVPYNSDINNIKVILQSKSKIA
jgi:O-antigen ligase